MSGRLSAWLAFLASVAAPLGAQNVPGPLRVAEEIEAVARGSRLFHAVAPSIQLDSLGVIPPGGDAHALGTEGGDLLARRLQAAGTRGRNAGIGALIGAGVGGIAGLLGASEFCSGSSSCGAKQYIVGFLLGGVAGAGVGALVGAVTGSS